MAVPAPQQNFVVTVDSKQVEGMLARAIIATQATALSVWLRTEASGYLHDEIVHRFAFEGDSKSGDRAPLAEGTQAIRHALGYPPDHPINERSGALLHWLASSQEIFGFAGGAAMNVPGSPPDKLTADKLTTAQQGSDNNPIPGFGPTPPRPVLAVDETDLIVIMASLAANIVYHVAGLLP